jgi:hypothetical protein
MRNFSKALVVSLTLFPQSIVATDVDGTESPTSSSAYLSSFSPSSCTTASSGCLNGEDEFERALARLGNPNISLLEQTQLLDTIRWRYAELALQGYHFGQRDIDRLTSITQIPHLPDDFRFSSLEAFLIVLQHDMLRFLWPYRCC